MEKFDKMLSDVQPLLHGDFNNILKIGYNDHKPSEDLVTISKFYKFLQERSQSLREGIILFRFFIISSFYS